ncbi:MAG: hypothetical protein QXU99_05340 [Candidatus Bathyarchaeia archaeon]
MVVFVVFSSFSVCAVEDYVVVFQLLDKIDGVVSYKLTIAVPRSLLEYYSRKSHRTVSANDFAKFVTPYALKPVADRLREIYGCDEDFANGVLMIVHQIPYEEIVAAKYPVETLVANKGDCDLFAYVVASILKAGGIDVVLLHYEKEKHMNVGVHLSEEPMHARSDVYSVVFDNVTYYVAECTGGNWTFGWRVGECPSNLKNATAKVISLDKVEDFSPGQVSASFAALEFSSISLDVSPFLVLQGSKVAIRGRLDPPKSFENVTIYVAASGSSWTAAGSALTDADGAFEYIWEAYAGGSYSVYAS